MAPVSGVEANKIHNLSAVVLFPEGELASDTVYCFKISKQFGPI